MTLVSTGSLVRRAVAARGGVFAFNFVTIEHVEAIVSGAEESRTAVILQLSQNAVAFHGNRIRPIAVAARELAESAGVEISLHLDHVDNTELLHQAADAGFSSVMFDAGARPYRDNVEATRSAAEWAHEAGLWIEAELGYVGGKPGVMASAHSAGVATDPAEAVAFVRHTGVDALAVAVGSSHAMTTQTATLDDELIKRLHAAVPVPLVLHGSSGVPDNALRQAVRAGITKINVGTALGIAFTSAVRKVLTQDPNLVDPRSYLLAARAAMASTVSRLTSQLADTDTPFIATHLRP